MKTQLEYLRSISLNLTIIRYLLALILGILVGIILAGCTTSEDLVYEDQLRITRKYIGEYIQTVDQKRNISIYTTEAVVKIAGHPELKIPEGSSCYLRYRAEQYAGNLQRYYVLYFTWNGTNDLYMVYQNPITGQIY